MAVGAGLVAWGVNNGLIEMGTQLVATEIGGSNVESIIGATAGSAIGAISGSIIGSIGVAGMGGAIGVPAAIIIGGAAAVLAMAGYTVGDIAHNLYEQSVGIPSLVSNGSLLVVGVAMIIDGARRCINDNKVLAALSKFKENVVYLTDLTVSIVARTMVELKGFIEELKKLPQDNIEAAANTSGTLIGAGLGVAAGSVAATSSVTLLGSHALGGVAVSLGLISAPVWPMLAGLAGCAGLGYATSKALKYWLDKSNMKRD